MAALLGRSLGAKALPMVLARPLGQDPLRLSRPFEASPLRKIEGGEILIEKGRSFFVAVELRKLALFHRAPAAST